MANSTAGGETRRHSTGLGADQPPHSPKRNAAETATSVLVAVVALSATHAADLDSEPYTLVTVMLKLPAAATAILSLAPADLTFGDE